MIAFKHELAEKLFVALVGNPERHKEMLEYNKSHPSLDVDRKNIKYAHELAERFINESKSL